MLLVDGTQILSPQLEPLAEAQRMLVGGLQHTSTQAEDALSQGMEKLQQNLAEILTAEADPFGAPDAYMLQMATAVEKLKELVNFVTQVTVHPSPPWMERKRRAWSGTHAPCRVDVWCPCGSPVRVCAGGPSPADDAATDAQDPDDAAGGQGPAGARRLLPAPPHAELAVGGAPAGGGD
jgi:hypothetical protein